MGTHLPKVWVLLLGGETQSQRDGQVLGLEESHQGGVMVKK